ncbi:hypothetical protein HFP72_28685 [Nocardiopsis sp. ARC36]
MFIMAATSLVRPGSSCRACLIRPWSSPAAPGSSGAAASPLTASSTWGAVLPRLSTAASTRWPSRTVPLAAASSVCVSTACP